MIFDLWHFLWCLLGFDCEAGMELESNTLFGTLCQPVAPFQTVCQLWSSSSPSHGMKLMKPPKLPPATYPKRCLSLAFLPPSHGWLVSQVQTSSSSANKSWTDPVKNFFTHSTECFSSSSSFRASVVAPLASLAVQKKGPKTCGSRKGILEMSRGFH